MKNYLVLFLFLTTLEFTSIGQYGTRYNELLDFETTEYRDFVHLDSNSIWVVGKPNKQHFTEAHSGSQAIITDSSITYPPNQTSCFYLTIDPINHLWFGYTVCELEFYHKIWCDSKSEGGFVEVSYDKGANWTNIILDTIDHTRPVYPWDDIFHTNYYGAEDTLIYGMPAFTGTIDSWQRSTTVWAAIGYKKSQIDTVLFRFCFISDSVENNNDGWIIDDIKIFSDFSGNVNSVSISNHIQIAPNPLIETSSITFQDIMDPSNIAIYSAIGQKILDEPLFDHHYNLSRKDFQSGLYFVKIITKESRIYTNKFIVR